MRDKLLGIIRTVIVRNDKRDSNLYAIRDPNPRNGTVFLTRAVKPFATMFLSYEIFIPLKIDVSCLYPVSRNILSNERDRFRALTGIVEPFVSPWFGVAFSYLAKSMFPRVASENILSNREIIFPWK